MNHETIKVMVLAVGTALALAILISVCNGEIFTPW